MNKESMFMTQRHDDVDSNPFSLTTTTCQRIRNCGAEAKWSNNDMNSNNAFSKMMKTKRARTEESASASASAATTAATSFSGKVKEQLMQMMKPSSSSLAGSASVAVGADASQLLAQELNDLTIEERELVYEEIHGVGTTIIDEKPDFVNDKIHKLEQELEQVKDKNQRYAYDRALFLSPGFVKNHNFLLMFLRADRFDPLKASVRLMIHLNAKLELFGEDKLCKSITLDDLNDDDMACLLTGSIQYLPAKDNTGRTVAFVSQNRYKFKTWQNQIRMTWYQTMYHLENDIQFQKGGLVDVLYDIERTTTYDEEHGYKSNFTELCSKAAYYLKDALPFRVVAYHYCYDKPTLKPIVSIIQLVLGTHGRLRFRAHYGSHIECLYSLVTFGIPTSAFPFTSSTGQFAIDKFKQLLKERKEKDANKEKGQLKILNKQHKHHRNTTFINCCLPTDVLLGRGKPYQQYNGNLLLGTIIEKYLIEYSAANDRSIKTQITKKIVQEFKSTYNGRFLQRSTICTCWEEVSDSVAREKVSSSFRAKKTKQQNTTTKNTKKTKKNQTTNNNNKNSKSKISKSKTTMKEQQQQHKGKHGNNTTTTTTTTIMNSFQEQPIEISSSLLLLPSSSSSSGGKRPKMSH